MKKRLISLLLAFLITAVFAACSAEMPGSSAAPAASESSVSSEPSGSSGNSIDLKPSGIGIDFPEQFKNLKGIIQIGGGNEVAQGVYLTDLVYYAMPYEKYSELMEKDQGGTLTEEDVEYFTVRCVDLLVAFTVDGSRSAADIADVIELTGLSADQFVKIGSAGEYSCYAIINPLPYLTDFETSFVFDEGFREEFDALTETLKSDLSVYRIYGPERTETAQAGSVVSFETADLDGNTVRSEELFGGSTLTMVNLWGTYCGPCISEMPDLQELSKRLTEKNCAVVGIVVDVSGAQDTDMISTAKDILSSTGVTYLNLTAWNGLGQAFPAQYIPTTYFVDSKGHIVGDPAVGARGADEYEALIDAILENLS